MNFIARTDDAGSSPNLRYFLLTFGPGDSNFSWACLLFFLVVRENFYHLFIDFISFFSVFLLVVISLGEFHRIAVSPRLY